MASPEFTVGDEVRLQSRPDRAGRITGPGVLIQDEYWYPIYFGPGQSGRHPESDLERYAATQDILQLLRDGRFAGREAFSKRVTHLKLACALRSHVYALQASRTTFYPYQFKPVLKVLDSWKHRLLIADEVGLGKTIEAGLILTELRARLDMARVLVVAPAHLLTKWQDEMRRRFAVDFRALDRKGAIEFLTAFEKEGEETRLQGVISLQTLRGRSLQERWEAVAPTFDLVVFDEAGRLRNSETLSHKAAALVGEGSDALLLLTATPVQTGERDLFSLLRLLDPDDFAEFDVYQKRLAANQHILNAMRLVRGGARGFPGALAELDALRTTEYGRRVSDSTLFLDVYQRVATSQDLGRRELVELQRDLNALNLFGHVLSRTRRREVDEERPVRVPSTVSCGPTAAERQFYNLVTQLCRQAYASCARSGIGAFATMMPQRQMASCMPAMVAYVREKLENGDWGARDPETSDLWPEYWDEDEEDDESLSGGLDWSALGDLEQRGRELETHDSKWIRFLEALRAIEVEQPGAKVVVFSFFKRTLAYLQRRLTQEGIRSVLISGDVRTAPDDPELDERGHRLDQFKRDDTVRILLSTEVGNEGIDLQFAHVLVNYDLPWNPMVVEQRIGRLDRIGQRASRIHIYNLTMPGTIEDLILERLYTRVRIFENSIGDLEDILGDVVRDLTMDLFSPELSPEQRERRIDQAANAVEEKRLQQEALEARVGSLIGNDEFFMDELHRIRDSRRYLTASELLVFVHDYLAAHHPRCEWKEASPGVWELGIDEDLRWSIRQRLGSDSPAYFNFQRRSARGTLRFTTDPELAQDRPDLDLLTFYHPLVTAISRHYADAPEELHPVSWVDLFTDELPAGRYVWLLHLVEVTGVRSGRDFEFVAAGLDGGGALTADQCDTLLWTMLAVGKARRRGEIPQVEIPADVLASIDAAAVGRLNRRFSEQQKINEATVTARLASLEESYRRNRTLREERLQVARQRNRAPQYLRMLEGGLRKLGETYEIRKRDLMAQRRLGRSLTLEGAGIVEVLDA